MIIRKKGRPRSADGQRKIPVSTRVSEEDYIRIMARLRETGLTMSNYIRYCITQDLDEADFLKEFTGESYDQFER